MLVWSSLHFYFISLPSLFFYPYIFILISLVFFYVIRTLLFEDPYILIVLSVHSFYILFYEVCGVAPGVSISSNCVPSSQQMICKRPVIICYMLLATSLMSAIESFWRARGVEMPGQRNWMTFHVCSQIDKQYLNSYQCRTILRGIYYVHEKMRVPDDALCKTTQL